MSDHSVTCTIYNELQDNGAIGLSSNTPNSGTTFSNTTTDSGGDIVNDFYPSDCGSFVAAGSEMAGCGGSATYTLPNNDLLVIQYNTSTGNNNAYCIALLQSGDTSTHAASSEYYCTASTDIASLDEDSISVTISVYQI